MASSDVPTGWERRGNENEATPSHNRPWPHVDPFAQGRFERKYMEDGATINFDTLPRFQSWAHLVGMGEHFRVYSVLKKVSIQSARGQRSLTNTEVNAIGEHTIRSLRYFTWAHPVASAFSGIAVLGGWRTFKFPFYTPKMKRFNPNIFPLKSIPLLSGSWARYAWHSLRFTTYMPVVWIPVYLIFGSISETTFEAHLMRDSRLAELAEDIRRNAKNALIAMQQQVRRQGGAPVRRQGGPASQGGEGVYQDGPAPQSYEGSEYAAQPNGRSRTTAPPGPVSHHQEDDDLFGDDDDASPVAPSSRRAQGPSSSSGSSWDRIRRQTKPGNPNWEAGDSSGQERGWAQLRQDKIRNSVDSTPRTESYSYSNADREREARKYEKEQAQKDFDALLEAERRGDSNDGSGSGNSSGRGRGRGEWK